MNSPPLSESRPSSAKGRLARTSRSASKVQRRARLRTTARLGPAGGHVGGAEAVGELAARIAALVADQVDLQKARPGLVPLGEGAHRDLAFEQAARLGEAACP